MYSLDNGETWADCAITSTGTQPNLSWSGTVSIDKEGSHSVVVKAITVAGVESEISSAFSLRRDTVLPSYKATKKPSSWTTENVVVTIVPSDNASGFAKMRFNGSEWTTAPGADYTVTENGNYTVEIVDVAGNVFTDTVTVGNIDRVPPEAPVVHGFLNSEEIVNGQWINDDCVITFTCDATNISGVAGYKYSTNYGLTWINGDTLTVTAAGTNTIVAKAISGSGVESEMSAPFVVNIDRVEPIYRKTLSTTAFTNQDITITFTGSDAASGFAKMRFNGSEWSTSSKNSYTVSESGDYTFEIVDVAGNVLIDVVSITNIDKVAPDYSVEWSETDFTSKDIILIISGDDDNSGFSKMRFNGGTWSSRITNKYTVTANGIYSIEVVDKAGNTLSDTIVVNNIDREKPSTPVITAAKVDGTNVPSGTWVSGQLEITFSGTYANPSGVSYYKYSTNNGRTWMAADGDTIIFDDAGTYSMVVKAVSGTGIESGVSEAYVIKVDKVAPTYNMSRSETGYTTQDVILTVSAKDADSGFYRMRFNNSEWRYVANTTFSVTINGTYTIEVVDVAGNVYSDKVKIDNIDKVAPDKPNIVCTRGPATIESGSWVNGTVTLNFTGTYTNPSGIKGYTYSFNGGATWLDSDASIQISENGTYYVNVKAISGAGMESEMSDTFVLNIDLINPTMTISGNPTNWASSATISIAPADPSGSGIAAVYMYDVDHNLVELEAPYKHVFTENGTYSFAVKDVAGNMAVDAITITRIDNQEPVIQAGTPRMVELSADRAYALIHLVGYDVGDSDFDYFRLPNGNEKRLTEIEYKVTTNGVFEFQGVDRAGNVATKRVSVSGLKVSNDTSICAMVVTEDSVFAQDLSGGAEGRISVDTTGVSNATFEVSCMGTDAVIVSINAVEFNVGTTSQSFSISADTEKTFAIKVLAADGTVEFYDVIISSKNEAPTLVSYNKANIEKTRYTESGSVTGGKFTAYRVGAEGVQIEIIAYEPNGGQYVSGYVSYDGINYPVYWDRTDMTKTEYRSNGSEQKKGYALIPVSAFYTGDKEKDADRNNTYAYIYLEDHTSEGGAVMLRSVADNNSLKIQTDVTAPVVNVKRYSTQYALKIGVSDTIGISDIDVTLTPRNGSKAGTPVTKSYTTKTVGEAVLMDEGIDYDVEIHVSDIAGHVTNITKQVGYSSGIISDAGEDIGGGTEPGTEDTPSTPGMTSGILVVDRVNTDGGVSKYKTRKGNYYIIGAASDGNYSEITHRANFFHDEDI